MSLRAQLGPCVERAGQCIHLSASKRPCRFPLRPPWSSCCPNPQASQPYWKCPLWCGPQLSCCLLCFLTSNPTPCTPRLLQDLFPKAAELYERVASNREHWTKVSHKFTIRGLPSNNSLDFLDEEYEVPDLDGPRAPVNGCCSLEAE